MFVLVLAPVGLVLVVLSFLGVAGIGPLSEQRRADRTGIGALRPAIGLLVGGGLVALAALGTLALVGLGGGDDDEVRRHERPDAAQPTRSPAPTAAPQPANRLSEVTIEARDDTTFPSTYDVADRLERSTVLRVHAVGFEPFASAVAEQCAPGIPGRCGNRIPVQFDAEGEARFQYLISDTLPDTQLPGGCRAGAAPCTVTVRTDETDGTDERGEIQTVFGDAVAPAGHIVVTPATGLSLGGEQVRVGVTGYPAGAQVTAMLCGAPDAVGSRCGAPGPTAAFVVGRDGAGGTDLLVTPGRVGRDSVPCARGDECGVSVSSDDVFARAPVVPVTFAAPPGAAYELRRLALGLAAAVVLLLLAAWLLVRTDWSAAGEAAAPEIDDAEYADLDAIVAALPPDVDELVAHR